MDGSFLEAATTETAEEQPNQVLEHKMLPVFIQPEVKDVAETGEKEKPHIQIIFSETALNSLLQKLHNNKLL